MLFSTMLRQSAYISAIRGCNLNQKRNEAILHGLQDAAALIGADGRPIGEVSVADLVVAYRKLGIPAREDFTEPDAQVRLFRRQVCHDIWWAIRVAMQDDIALGAGQVAGALPWFETIQKAWSCHTDARLAALSEGARWALAELQHSRSPHEFDQD